MREIKERCLSRKDYLKKDNSNVGYAFYTPKGGMNFIDVNTVEK